MIHKYIQTNGIRLHLVEAGMEQSGPTIVLLHGFPEFWRAWMGQIEPLVQAGFRLLIPDQRGYNLSDKPEAVDAYHLDQLAADIVGLLDHYQIEQAIIVGHDWGAAVAWHLAIHHAERVAKLGILNVPHLDVMSRYLKNNRQQRKQSWYIGFFQIPLLPERLLRANNYRALIGVVGDRKEGVRLSAEEKEWYRQAWSQPGAVRSMLHWYRSVGRANWRSFFSTVEPKRVQVETLIIWGEKDIALMKEMGEESVALCVHGRLVTFPEATHWVQHDEAEKVSQLLIDFCTE